MNKKTMVSVAGDATMFSPIVTVLTPDTAAFGSYASSHFKYFAPLLLVSLAACSQGTTPSQEPTPQVQTAAKQAPAVDTCTSNAQVAIDFVNQYIRHLNSNLVAENPEDTYEWLKSNSLVDPSVASAYSTFDLVDGDPILDAQDYPDKFELSSCSEISGVIQLQGVGNSNFKIPVKVASVSNVLKVVGVGTVNMQAAAPTAVTSASPNHKDSAEYKEAYKCAMESFKDGYGNGPAAYCIGNSRDPSEIEEEAYKDAEHDFSKK